MASDEALRKQTATLLRSAGLMCRRMHSGDPAAALSTFKDLTNEIIDEWDDEVRLSDL